MPITTTGAGIAGGDSSPPVVSSKTIPAAGTTLIVVFSEAVKGFVAGANGFTVTSSSTPVTLSYSSGEGTDTVTFATSRTISIGETDTLTYTPGVITDIAGNSLAGFGPVAITNNSTQVTLLTNLEAYWGFDNVLTDSSGNNRTLSGSAPFSSSAFFKKLGAAALQPSSSAVSIVWGGAFDLLNNDVSITVWVSHNGGSTNDFGDIGWSGIFTVGGIIDTLFEGKVTAKVGSSTVYTGPSGGIPNRTPTFLVLTWNHTTGTWIVYVNGSQVATASGVTPATHALTGTFTARTNNVSNTFGNDDTSVYSRVLSQAEVTSLYNSGTGLNPTL